MEVNFEVCACGKFLMSVIKDGRQIGVTHAPEDEDCHNEFFGSYQVIILDEQPPETNPHE